MAWWRAIKRRLHDLVFTRDVAEIAGDVLGSADASAGTRRSFVGRVFDALLYGLTYVLAPLTDVVQAFAPLSYLVCFFLAVIFVPPVAGRLTLWTKRLSRRDVTEAAIPPPRASSGTAPSATDVSSDQVARLVVAQDLFGRWMAHAGRAQRDGMRALLARRLREEAPACRTQERALTTSQSSPLPSTGTCLVSQES